MLHEFITANRDAITARTRERVESRQWPSVSPREIEHGVPLLLTQLSETLRLEATDTPFPSNVIGPEAARRGGALLGAGFNVSQVVHDYGDICQAITGLAVEQRAPITVEEFHTLNRCLDTAIAEAVAEHARITAQTRSAEEVESLGHAAHELRDILNTALLAFHMLTRHRRHQRKYWRASRVQPDGPAGGRLIVEVEDACGGFPESESDLFQVFGDRHGSDRSGLGLALSIARKAMRAHGGDVHIRNMPGKGCVFAIEMPLAAAEDVRPPPSLLPPTPCNVTGCHVSLPQSPTGLYWSLRGQVACPYHASQIEESRWMTDGWAPIPSSSRGFRGMRYQCQYCSVDHTAIVHRPAANPARTSDSDRSD